MLSVYVITTKEADFTAFQMAAMGYDIGYKEI
jgi:hypothetical protein